MAKWQAGLNSPDSSWLRSIINSSNDAIISKTLEGIVTSWNPAAERMFGYTSDEMVGQSIRILLPPEREHEEDEILAKIGSGEKVDYFETERVTKSGEILTISVSISPIHDEDGNPVGASKIARDITALKRERRRLEESEARFRALADNISQFAWMTDRTGYIFWYNKRWFDYTGTTLEEMQGWGWKAVHDPDHVERVDKRFMHSIETGEPWEDTFPLRGKDGNYRWFLSRALPIYGEDGDILLWFGTNTDITEQREHQERIQLLMQEVNHRTKNMLSLVQAIARQTVASSPEDFSNRFTERLQALARNQDILVNNEWRGVSLKALCESQLSPFADLVGRRILINGPEVMLSAMAAQSIGLTMHELATNAGKYGALSNETGTVTIDWAVSGEKSGAPKLVLTWREQDGPKVSAPARRGFGTTAIEKMSEMALSATVSVDYAETGLKWRLEADGDRVFESREPHHAPSWTETPLHLSSAGKRRILIVEDEALIALELAQILEDNGYEIVGPAGNVARAQALITEEGCDFAILDVNLGRESSVPVARRLKDMGTGFISISGYSPNQRPEIFRAGITLPKPVDPEKLAELVRSSLQNS